ncbi:MAG: chorismate-binding protein, partial [Deltaproteobacteria bacterium]
MQQPSLEEFRKLAGQSGLVPVYREIIADLDTPLTIFAKVAGGKSHAFLLESLEGGEEWGRYSFIGLDPLVTMESVGEEITIQWPEKKEKRKGDPIDALKQLLSSFRACNTDYLPRFFGGAVGFMGYDMVRFMERLPELTPRLQLFPDSSLMVPSIVLIYDNLKQTLAIVHCVQIDASIPVEHQYAEAGQKIDAVITNLKNTPLPPTMLGVEGCERRHDFASNMNQQAFHDMVEQAKEYIRAGDIIQVVLSQRFHTTTEVDPFTLYRALR